MLALRLGFEAPRGRDILTMRINQNRRDLILDGLAPARPLLYPSDIVPAVAQVVVSNSCVDEDSSEELDVGTFRSSTLTCASLP